MEDKEKQRARDFMMKFMEAMLERSPLNVEAPLPLVEEKACTRLTTDDYIAWKQILKEWQKVSSEGKKQIAILLSLNANTLSELLSNKTSLLQEAKDTAAYVSEHPEFQKNPGDMDEEDLLDKLKDILD